MPRTESGTLPLSFSNMILLLYLSWDNFLMNALLSYTMRVILKNPANRFILLLLKASLIFTCSVMVQSAPAQENGKDNRHTPESSANPEDKIIYVKKVKSSIKIDGIIDDLEWQESIPATGFIQQEPDDNSPATEKTIIRIMRDDENLYFAISCYDSEPDKIIVNEMRRDGHLQNNDNIEIFLDTFNDKKNFYYFRTNPAGAKFDAFVSDEGKDVNDSWNTIWKCGAKINENGWEVEISIPLYAIRFDEETDNWGINIGREIRRKNEKTYWSYIPRALMQSGKYRASLFGKMTGLKGLSKPKNLDIVPYAKGKQSNEYTVANSASHLDGGVDLSYRLTGNLRTEFSYNTDFAQVEADQEVVNVSRFNLLFPEKREFFLENSGHFQFGDMVLYERITGGGGGGSRVSTSPISTSQSNYMLYYSRRIGLNEETEIPLYGGTKFTGKAGKNSIGFMSMQTMDQELLDGGSEPSTNYSIVRVKRDILRNSSLGFIALNKQSSSQKYNRSFGIDGNFPLNSYFTTGGSFAKTLTPGIKGKDYAGTFFMDMKKDFFAWNLKYLHLEDNFNPEMGFLRRERVRSTYTTATLQKWINQYGFRNILFYSGFNYVTDNQNELESKRLFGSAIAYFSSGDGVSFDVYRDYDYLDEDDDINEVLLPADNYKFNLYRVRFNSDHGRVFAGAIEYRFGDYYKGKVRTLSPHYHIRPSPHFNIDMYYYYNHVELPNGSFYSNVLSTRVTYMVNPDFYIKSYTQWNDLDNHLSNNLLFHYIHNSANNFYLVYNENRDPNTRGMHMKDRVFMIKFSYHFFV